MEHVHLGNSGLRVSKLVFGTLTFAGTHGFEAVGPWPVPRRGARSTSRSTRA